MPTDLLMHWDKSVRAMCGASASVWGVLKTGAECLWESWTTTALTNWFGSLLKLMYAPTFDLMMSFCPALPFADPRGLGLDACDLVPELEIHANVK